MNIFLAKTLSEINDLQHKISELEFDLNYFKSLKEKMYKSSIDHIGFDKSNTEFFVGDKTSLNIKLQNVLVKYFEDKIYHIEIDIAESENKLKNLLKL